MNSKQFLKEGFLEDAHEAHVDHEVQMARVDCYYAAEHAIVLHKLLRNISEEQGLEGWVASKITLANDYLKSVREHLEYQMMNADADEDDFLPLAEGLSQTKKKVSEDITDRDDGIEEFERGPWYVILRGQPVTENGEPKRFNWLNGAKTYFRSMLDDQPELAREIKSEYDKADDKKTVIYYTKKLPTTSSSNTQPDIGQQVSEAGNKPGLWANIRAKRERIKRGSGERMRKPGSKGAPSDTDLKSIRAASNESTELEESLADEFGEFAKKFGQQRGITIKPRDPKPRSPFPGPENKGAELPLDRETLEARLKELQSRFDPAYEYSDDHAFWSEQNEIAKEIRSIKRALSQQGVAEGTLDARHTPDTDQILQHLTSAFYNMRKYSDSYSNFETVERVYNFLRSSLKQGDYEDFMRRYEGALSRYPDAATELIGEMFADAGLDTRTATIEDFLDKVGTQGVTEGFKNTYNVGDRVDSPLGTGTIVAVSKNINVDGRVKVKLDDPSRAGEDGKYKDSFVLDTIQLKHISEQSVAEGKFTINAKTGAKLDPRTGVELPPKEKPMTMKQMFAQPKQPKLTLDDVWFKIQSVVSNIYPDGDPIDHLAPWLKKHGIRDFKIGEILDRAAKKNGYKDLYDYWESMGDLPLSEQGVAEGSLEEVNTRTLVNYVPKAGRTLASLSPEERKKRSGMMTRAYQKLIPRSDFSDEIKKYHDEKNKKQGVAEGGILKSIKRGLQGWGMGNAPTPQELVRRNKGHSDDDIKALAIDTRKVIPHSPADLQKRVVDREMKKRGLGEEGVAEGKVDNYKDMGANKDTTHFVKNMTTGKIVSPHRSKKDAEEALIANMRDSKDEFKIVRARKESMEKDSGNAVEALIQVYNNRDQKIIKTKVFASEAEANRWADRNNAVILKLKDVPKKSTLDETSAGSVATVVNPTPKNRAKVGTLFGGTYKQTYTRGKK